MFSGHGQDYLLDNLAFIISLVPFILVAALIVASLVEEPLRVRVTVRERNRRSR
jgi:hypothetical protein